ncbi:MAG: TM2 domain-containing protein [Flavisolibacter sp.]
MDSNQMLMMLPGVQPEEVLFIQNLTQELSEEEKKQFITFYSGERREQQNLTILTIVGFFGVAGLQRFVTGDIGLGVVYLITLGFCGIGTIIDLVNIKRIATDYNQKKAVETIGKLKWMNQKGY